MKNKEEVKKELASFYKGLEAKDYDLLRNMSPSNKKIMNVQKKIIRNLVSSSTGKKILDVACGTGFFFKEYGQKEVYGIDISEEMLKIAKLNNPLNTKVLKVGDALHLPFKDNFFDVTITNRFLMHTPEFSRIISEMVRVTKKGGSIILDLPNKNSISYIFTKFRIMLGKIRYFNFFTKNDIVDICKRNHLEIADIKGTTVLTYKAVPQSLYWFIDKLNDVKFLKDNLSYIFYVRLIKNEL